jgi:hypothetical protein
MNDLYKTIINLGFIILACVAVCLDIALGFFVIFNDKTTTGINFIDEQNGLDFVSEFVDGNTADNEVLQQFENRYFFEANLYDNSNNNGVMLQELKMNYFSSQNLMTADYYSSGMQYKDLTKPYVFEWNTITGQDANGYERPEFNYYSTVIGLSANWGKAQTPLNRGTYYIVKIDGEPYRIKLQGYYTTTWDNSKWYNPFSWGDKGTIYWYYGFGNVFADIMNGIKSNNLGTGTHFAVLDLSKYFTVIEKYNASNSKWEPQTTDLVKNYVAIKFHYSSNGAIKSSQSLFGIINDDPTYDIDESRYDTTYWQERIKYTLTNKDLSYRYSSQYNGYFLSLSQDMKTLFKTMPRAEVSVKIDINYDDRNILGLDFDAFKGFHLKEVKVNTTGNFILLPNALLNTGITAVIKGGA